MTALFPSSTALLIASVIPRSLNEPVGLAPSHLSQRESGGSPIFLARLLAGISGVSPSFKVMIGEFAETGSRAR